MGVPIVNMKVVYTVKMKIILIQIENTIKSSIINMRETITMEDFLLKKKVEACITPRR